MPPRFSRLTFMRLQESVYANENHRLFNRKIYQTFSFWFAAMLIPFVSVRVMQNLDHLPIWEQRIEKKRVRKMAFDYMLKSQAEKEKDLIEEFSDF